ncbi:MAG TPA: hypothetical protein VIV27_00095, partial [Halioglobus sp.]
VAPQSIAFGGVQEQPGIVGPDGQGMLGHARAGQESSREQEWRAAQKQRRKVMSVAHRPSRTAHHWRRDSTSQVR